MSLVTSVLTVRVPYKSGLFEHVPCEPISPTVMHLTEFAEQAPLGPGDWVTVDMDGNATVLTPTHGWLVEFHLSSHLSRDAQLGLAKEWSRDVEAVMLTEVWNVARVLTDDRDWLHATERHERVMAAIVRREPGEDVQLPWNDDEDPTALRPSF